MSTSNTKSLGIIEQITTGTSTTSNGDFLVTAGNNYYQAQKEILNEYDKKIDSEKDNLSNFREKYPLEAEQILDHKPDFPREKIKARLTELEDRLNDIEEKSSRDSEENIKAKQDAFLDKLDLSPKGRLEKKESNYSSAANWYNASARTAIINKNAARDRQKARFTKQFQELMREQNLNKIHGNNL